MGFGRSAARRREAARQHSFRKHYCRCGREIFGNAYYAHRKACQSALAQKEKPKSMQEYLAMSDEEKIKLIQEENPGFLVGEAPHPQSDRGKP